MFSGSQKPWWYLGSTGLNGFPNPEFNSVSTRQTYLQEKLSFSFFSIWYLKHKHAHTFLIEKHKTIIYLGNFLKLCFGVIHTAWLFAPWLGFLHPSSAEVCTPHAEAYLQNSCLFCKLGYLEGHLTLGEEARNKHLTVQHEGVGHAPKARVGLSYASCRDATWPLMKLVSKPLLVPFQCRKSSSCWLYVCACTSSEYYPASIF